MPKATETASLNPHISSTLLVALESTPLYPIITHLNADSSWLLLLPLPTPTPSKRRFFSVLIDPWLKGPQQDVTRFLSRQSHATESRFGTLKEVEVFVRDVERCAGMEMSDGGGKETAGEECWIDLCCVSHEFTDHCHQDTLLELPPSVPIFATSKAASLIQSWKYFTSVTEPPSFPASTSFLSLPSWLSIHRMTSPSNALYYHAALLFTFSSSPTTSQAIIYTPHGIAPAALSTLISSDDIQVLAVLHGLHNITLGPSQLNLGAHNGLAVVRATKAKYWIGTHDEEKKAGGIVKWFLKRQKISIEQAVENSTEKTESGYIDLSNGESLIMI